MKYKNIKRAKFIKRENRFIAECMIDGKVEKVHIKNTGRCEELFTYNADVYVSYVGGEKRKTKYDLISVYKEGRLFLVDSQSPNKLFREGVIEGKIDLGFKVEEKHIKSEKKYKNSRFDFYIENEKVKAYVEVKGVNLKEGNKALFPDGVTKRGMRHLDELCELKKEGYEAYIVFIVQFEGAKCFMVNPKDEEFHKTLKNAVDKGVKALCYDCKVEKDTVKISKDIEIMV